MTRWWVVVVTCASACWSSDDLIDGAFTPEQWRTLQLQLAFDPPASCTLPGAGFDLVHCAPATTLAFELFSDVRLSCDPDVIKTGCTPTSCWTCHDPTHGYVDSRTPDNVSLTSSGWTSRNAMTLLDVGYKEMRAGAATAFTWSGKYKSAGQVLDLAVTKPMKSSHHHVATLIRNDGNYFMQYTAAFNEQPSSDDDHVFGNLERAFDAYLGTLSTTVTPFDAWLQGDVSPNMSDSAKRGFAIFVGKGTCIECHSGPLFSDLQFHDTGVPQTGDHVPATDLGRGAVTMQAADDGAFLTGTLRDIAATGPYMHDGAFATLADVIDFYRHGGVAAGYSGTRDPRITNLDLTDDDAHDLEAFLRSLSDGDCDDDATKCPTPRDAGMADALLDVAPPPDVAVMCPPGMTACGPLCADLQIDPMNCGACGSACAYPTPNCTAGHCGP